MPCALRWTTRLTFGRRRLAASFDTRGSFLDRRQTPLPAEAVYTRHMLHDGAIHRSNARGGKPRLRIRRATAARATSSGRGGELGVEIREAVVLGTTFVLYQSGDGCEQRKVEWQGGRVSQPEMLHKASCHDRLWREFGWHAAQQTGGWRPGAPRVIGVSRRDTSNCRTPCKRGENTQVSAQY